MSMKSFPKILGWAALLVWLASIYLFLQYDATRPTSPQPAQGRIYSSNNHGHVTYLTNREENYLNGLAIAAFSLFTVAALMGYFQGNPRRIGELRSSAIGTLRAVVRPASWRALVLRPRRQPVSVGGRSVTATLFGQNRICLHSNETVSDCRTRLAGRVGFNLVGPIAGNVSGDKFDLYVRQKDFRNSFAPHLHGKFVAAASGTVIEGKFRMHFFVRVFLAIWFTGVTVIGGRMASFSIKRLAEGSPAANLHVGLFFPAVLLLFGLLIVYWCKALGVDDEAQMVRFLRHTLNARP